MELIRAIEIMETDPRHERLPYDSIYEEGCGWQVDHVCPAPDTTISIRDEGFLRSTAVYDAVSVSRGQFFRLDDHIERFFRSAKTMFLRPSMKPDEIRQILHKVVALTGLQDACIYFLVTRGEMTWEAGPQRRTIKNPSIPRQGPVYAFSEPYAPQHDDDRQARGIHAIINETVIRIPPQAVDPRAKNFHWLDLSAGMIEAIKKGAEACVLTDGNGNLTESAGSNIFLVKDGVVVTPSDGCLEGITRQTTFELCEEFGIQCEVRKVGADELRNADEAFFTTTAGGIMPMGSVDGKDLGGKPGAGELSVRLHNAYWEKRWAGWHGEPVDYSLASAGS